MKASSTLFLVLLALGLITSLSFLFQITRHTCQTSAFTTSALPSQGHTVMLTFDVDGDTQEIPSILQTLDTFHAKATFFITGDSLRNSPAHIEAIAAAGHELGNHTMHHADLTLLNEKKQIEEIITLHRQVKDLTGVSMRWFRPPYGAYDNAVIQSARKSSYQTATWSIDSCDWRENRPEVIASIVCENPALSNGAIILMHADSVSISRALSLILPQLSKKGYTFSTLSSSS